MTTIQAVGDFNFVPHKPSPKQAFFLRLGCREALYGGRAGCGKSDAILASAAQGFMIPSYCALVLRRTYKDLSKPNALMDRAHQWWSSSGAHWSDDNKTWTMPSGARLTFGYLESENDVERYQGPDFHYVGFDEQGQFSGSQFTYMFSRIRRTSEFPTDFPLRARGTANPGGIGHTFITDRYGIPNGTGFTDDAKPVVIRRNEEVVRVFVPASAKDNPGLDWQDYEKSLAELSEIRRKQLRDGIWIQDQAELVYHGASKAKYIDCLPPDHEWEYGLVLDVGASNTAAFAILAWCSDLPETFLTSTCEPLECKNARDQAKWIERADKIYHFTFIRGDHGALGKGYLDEMRKYHSIPISGVEKKDKRGYIELLNDALETHRLVIVRGGTETWQKQAGELLWKDERRLEEMPGMRNHSCDAALYAWREAKHYSHETREPKPKLDAIEQAEMDAIDDELAALELDGCQLPDCYR